MEVLVLRFDAPLMAFGGPAVDHHGVVQAFPALSMLTGLIGNALGYAHGDAGALNRLQARLRFAARLDRPGRAMVDYQTVDLSQDFLVDTGWTSWGIREDRKGGEAREMTHVRFRHYRANSVCTVVISVNPPDESPALDQIAAALEEPARPLYLGRKSCLPASPLLAGRREAHSLLDALKAIPGRGQERVSAQWPAEEGEEPTSRLLSITDERDWVNQIHCGERLVRQGEIEIRGDRDG